MRIRLTCTIIVGMLLFTAVQIRETGNIAIHAQCMVSTVIGLKAMGPLFNAPPDGYSDATYPRCVQPVTLIGGDSPIVRAYFGQLSIVESITITNTNDTQKCGDLEMFHVFLSNSTNPNGFSKELCFDFRSRLQHSETRTISCTRPLAALYITIEKYGGASPNQFTFCNLKIHGYRAEFRGGVALGKPAQQSGSRNGQTANLAVDGISDIFDNCALVDVNDLTYMGDKMVAWLQVDLQDQYTIIDVTVYSDNTSDMSDLSCFNILAGNDSDNISSHQKCGYYPGVVSNGRSWTMTCPPGLVGQFVTIWKDHCQSTTMTLCEVKLTAIKYARTESTLTTTTQSQSAQTMTTPAIGPSPSISTLPAAAPSGSTTSQFTSNAGQRAMSVGIIIAIAVGVFLIVIVLVVIGVVYCCRR